MRLLYDNKADDYTPIVSTEETGYLGTNAQHIHLSKVWRTTADAAQSWKIDAGAGNTITATAAAIIGRGNYRHNLTSAVTAKIQGHPTDAWGAPDVDQTLVYDADIMLKFFTSAAKRFWRFYLDDAANPDTYLEVPRLFLGTYLQFPITFEKDFSEKHANTSKMTLSLSGQPYVDVGYVGREYELRFTFLEDSDKRSLATALNAVALQEPVLLVLDENNLVALPPIYGILTEEPAFDHLVGYIWQCSLKIRETF